MSANHHLIEVFTRHQIFMQRYAGGINKDVQLILEDMLLRINNQIATGKAGSSVARLQVLGEFIDQIVNQAMVTAKDLTTEQLKELPAYEAGFIHQAINDVANVNFVLPSQSQINAVVTNAVAELGTDKITVNDMFAELREKKGGEIKRIVQQGLISGSPIDEVIKETSRVINKRTSRQVETVIRTATNHIANQARKSVYKENKDYIDHEQWISTLDGGTSITCAGLDSEVFEVGEGRYPPIHFNCRSVRIPYISPEYTDGELFGERSSIDGPVSSATTYNSFMKRQSKSFQNEVLGVERAKLFRGGLHVSKFTDDNGIVYNLDKLRELEPMAFERTGL